METRVKCNYGPCKNRPSVLMLGYCQKHQRQRIYNEGIITGKQYCRFFFRGCDNEIPSDKKTCDSCLKKKHEDKHSCAHEGCTFHVTTEKYCGKHLRDKYRDEEKDKGIRYCDISRGCFQLCKTGFAACEACLLEDRMKEKECFEKRSEIVKHLKEEDSSNRLCVMCGILYDKYITMKGVESTRCLKCRDTMRKQDEKRVNRERNYKRENLENIERYYNAYKLSAKRRNHEFSITQKQFEELVREPCYYCDTKEEGEAVGIDRVDSNIGYRIENSRPCCEICNAFKFTYHVIYFLTKAKYIATNTKPDTEFHTKWKYSYSLGTTTYSRYKYDCKSREIEFPLTESQWTKLTSGSCYICGFDKTPIGIDRYINSIRSYTYENCRPCCSPCNVMKSIYSFEQLKEQCEKIYKKWPDPSVIDTLLYAPPKK